MPVRRIGLIVESRGWFRLPLVMRRCFYGPTGGVYPTGVSIRVSGKAQYRR